MSEDDIKKLQSTGGDHLAATEKNILGNHLSTLWDIVKSLKGGRIDFVLDNAGFELYCDMVYGQLSPCPIRVEYLDSETIIVFSAQPITLSKQDTAQQYISMANALRGSSLTSRVKIGTGSSILVCMGISSRWPLPKR